MVIPYVQKNRSLSQYLDWSDFSIRDPQLLLFNLSLAIGIGVRRKLCLRRHTDIL